MLSFPRRNKMKVGIPLTSLIDIVFLLLVYFLLTSNFVTQEAIDIRLPRVTTERPAAEQLVVVSVDRQGNIFMAGARLDERLLSQQLRHALSAASRPEVVVKADRDARYERIITVLDIAKQSGAADMHLAVERR